MFPGISTELHIFLLWKQDGRGYIILTNLGKEDTRLIRKERVYKRGILDLIMQMSKMLVPIAVLVVKEWGTKPKNSIGTKNLSWVKKLATQNKPKDRRVSEFWRWPLTAVGLRSVGFGATHFSLDKSRMGGDAFQV